jgi:spore photoproduct lyase
MFAEKNSNVILELKTKSPNVDYLVKTDYPRNVLATWSLNTPTIIENEEHRTASLDLRLAAARKVADKNRLVGFHFHPMIHYDDFKLDYKAVVDQLLATFKPEEVALVSIGTITFTKKVIQKIRSRDIQSKILQMPFEEIAGKFSYPDSIKEEMFTYLYECLKPWHGKVFFYLCMEPTHLWPKVFGYQYKDNLEFEQAMKKSYYDKIKS